MNIFSFCVSGMLPVFSDMPPEIVLKILSCLDWRTLLRCYAVCQSWRHLILKTAYLQYIIELGAEGLVDGPSGHSAGEKLKVLLERRRAWRRLDWKRKVTVPIPGDCQAYELVAGVFAKGMNPTGFGPGSRHFILSKLPTSQTKGETLIREDIGLTCRDFAIDPSQDFIALVEQPGGDAPFRTAVRIHLRTLSTNQSHPKAAAPVLSYSLEETFDGAVIQVFDDTVALFFWMHAIPRFLIWKWTEGTLLIHKVDPVAYRFVDDFSLLSNRAFMMTSRFPFGAIKVYSFRPRRGGGATTALTTLCLPELQENNHYLEFTSHTAPFTAHVPADKPFYTAEDARLHVMSIATSPEQNHPGGGHMANFVMAVHNRTLLAHALPVPDDDDAMNARAERVVPWEEWGPPKTRFFPERLSCAWQRYVHGSRFIKARHGAWPGTRCRMQVLDFGVHPARAGDDDRSAEARDAVEPDCACEHRLVLAPTRIHDPALFQRDVESRLPYREATSKAEFAYSGFMIDDERVVGLLAAAFSHGDMRGVDVFTF